MKAARMELKWTYTFMQRSNWIMWCWLACKWNAANRVTWSSYTAAVTHRCSAHRGLRRNWNRPI